VTADLYAGARQRIISLVNEVGVEAVARRIVPATPKWTVHHLLAHLRGEIADVADNNLEGAPGDEWTAKQVARWADTPIPVLLHEWDHDSKYVEALLRSGTAGPFSVPLVMDIHAHEQDLRGLLGTPGERTGAFYEWAVPILGGRIADRVAKAGLAPMAIITPVGRFGADDATVTLTISEWEYTRVAFGRRSLSQVCTLQWGGVDDPSAYAPLLSRFGLSATPLLETP